MSYRCGRSAWLERYVACVLCYFFFQAEDGIRDLTVTGVQTCALPIFKRAFRRLARELHPDVSEEPDAEHRFREVVEAYEVLSNSERRELSDRFGHAGLRGGGFQPSAFDLGSLSDLFSAFFGDDLFGVGGRMGRARGADIAARVEIDLADVATGTKREVPFGVAVSCDRCAGNGAEPDTPVRACPSCGGNGRVRQVSRSVFGEF